MGRKHAHLTTLSAVLLNGPTSPHMPGLRDCGSCLMNSTCLPHRYTSTPVLRGGSCPYFSKLNLSLGKILSCRATFQAQPPMYIRTLSGQNSHEIPPQKTNIGMPSSDVPCLSTPITRELQRHNRGLGYHRLRCDEVIGAGRRQPFGSEKAGESLDFS